jgi:hypothetical protein
MVMAGFEAEYVLGEATAWQRLKRDYRLGKHILRVFWMWLTVGRRMRRATRQAEASGGSFRIDYLKRGRI